jgi:hypothetical protein
MYFKVGLRAAPAAAGTCPARFQKPYQTRKAAVAGLFSDGGIGVSQGKKIPLHAYEQACEEL